MANKWDIGNAILTEQFEAWVDAIIAAGTSFEVHLYKNTYEPVPGTVVADFTESTFPGYAPVTLNTANFVPAIVDGFELYTFNDELAEYEADGTGFSSEPCVGYYVTDTIGGYWWSESFSTPLTIVPFFEVRLKAIMRHCTKPN